MTPSSAERLDRPTAPADVQCSTPGCSGRWEPRWYPGSEAQLPGTLARLRWSGGWWSEPPRHPEAWLCEDCTVHLARRREEQERQDAALERLGGTGIPKRYRALRLDRIFTPLPGEDEAGFRSRVAASDPPALGLTRWNRHLVEFLRAWRPGCPAAYVHGPVGSGKSALLAAWAIGQHLERDPGRGRPIVRWSSEAQVLALLRQRVISSPVEVFAGAAVAVLDDVGGVESLQDWQADRLEELVDWAYTEEVAMFCTSNRTLDELGADASRGERIASRLLEMVGGRAFQLGGLAEAPGWSWRTGAAFAPGGAE